MKIAVTRGFGSHGRAPHPPEHKMARKGTSKRKGNSKFVSTAKICNKKKGKAAKKACWRSHYKK